MKYLDSLRKYPQPMLLVWAFMLISVTWFILAWMEGRNNDFKSALLQVSLGSVQFTIALGFYMRATNRLLLDEIDRLKRKIERMDSED